MGFWANLWDRSPSGITPNVNPETSVSPTWNPGDPEGVVVDIEPVETRSLPVIRPTPWDGWPAEWNIPNWDMGSRFNELVDVAWMCLDINSRILSAMPVYRTQNGRVQLPVSWMQNPDDSIYTGWSEFAKQMFWDYLLGESFVWSMSDFADGFPARFRVLPPWMVKVGMRQGRRTYTLAGPERDITDEILHIRYKSTSDGKRGVGPLESAGGRMLTAGILAKYVREVVSVGGIPLQTLESDQELDAEDAQDLLNQWVTTRAQNLGYPPVLDNATKLVDHKSVSPRDMALLEIAQFTESRIAQLLGVPPFLAGLPVTGGGDSMTYSNVSQLFDYHDRSALKPFASSVMEALSNWALPRGQAAELNRDEYTRPPFNERAEAWVKLLAAGAVTVEEFRVAERLTGTMPAQAITGATLNGSNGDVELETV
jgi:HK97 family phage portal protein